MTQVDNPDAYIAAAPEPLRPLLERLRAVLTKALPDADEIIAYGIPGFRIGTVIVAGYAAFSKQCGLYIDPAAIAAHTDEIAALKLKATKTGVTFSPTVPIPDRLIEELAIRSRDSKGI